MSKTMLESNIFNDSWFFSLTNEAKLLFLFLIANPQCNLIGCYELPIALIIPHLKTTEQKLMSYFDELKEKVVYVDGWVVIKNYEKHNPMRNPNIDKSKQDQIDSLPEKIKTILESLNKGLANPYQRVGKPSKETEKEKEIEGGVGETKINTFEKLTDSVVVEVAEKCQISRSDAFLVRQKMGAWLKAKGKTYKDFKAALEDWILKGITDGKIKKYLGQSSNLADRIRKKQGATV